jgi:transposase-like protein
MNLTDKIFHDDEAARLHLEAQRWPDGPYCPRCGECENVTRLGGNSTATGLCFCNSCRTKFSVTMGTVFERSHIPLSKWMLGFRLMASSKKGISALQLQRSLDLKSYKSAWFMAHRIRAAMAETTPPTLGGEGKTVEADETYVGGKEGNKHANKRLRRRDLVQDAKQAVVVLVERDGRARSFHVASVNAKTLRKVLVANVSRKSDLMTDKASIYVRVGGEFARHESVDHGAGEYVRDGVIHSNSAESYFAILKRGVYGTFHSVSEAHLHRYLAEFDFRYSNRSAMGVDDTERTDRAIKGSTGKRLTYRRTRQGANA